MPEIRIPDEAVAAAVIAHDDARWPETDELPMRAAIRAALSEMGATVEGRRLRGEGYGPPQQRIVTRWLPVEPSGK